MFTETLAGLRDIDDVHGGFLLGRDGELLARDLPAAFGADIFSEIGPRLVRLRETLEGDGEDVSTLTLRFSEHKLHLRAVGRFLLGVVTNGKVNGPALRMAINLVARRVASKGRDLPVEVESETPTTPASPLPSSDAGSWARAR